LDYLTTHTSLSPIRRGFATGFVNYKIGCTRLAGASDKVYQLLAHGRWFSPGTTSSSTTKTGRRDIAEILLKVALNTKNQLKKINQRSNIVTDYLAQRSDHNIDHHDKLSDNNIDNIDQRSNRVIDYLDQRSDRDINNLVN